MAKFAAVLILFLFALSMVATTTVMAKDSKRYGSGSVKVYQCPNQCTRRCSRTQYHKPCMFFCQKCCRKCQCVPPGFYGNKQVCACYNNWKTQQGGPKCP
ncbi:unnamed protein product [Rhodiola kirilowii]